MYSHSELHRSAKREARYRRAAVIRSVSALSYVATDAPTALIAIRVHDSLRRISRASNLSGPQKEELFTICIRALPIT